jgi:hypothetical protein
MKVFWLAWLGALLGGEIYARVSHRMTFTKWAVTHIPEFVAVPFVIWLLFHIVFAYGKR